MSTWIAFLICAAIIAALFYLDRDRSVQLSKALWLPTLWLLIIGSRPVSAWLGVLLGSGSFGAPAEAVGGNLNAQLDGSPADALIYMLLLLAGIAVLFYRRPRALALLKVNLPVLIFLAYCLLSICWSPFPAVAFKRWAKCIGDLVMVLVILTDTEPGAALRKVFSRVGFILLPLSIFLIRYSTIGRNFAPDGSPMNTGVTENKNTLGLLTFFVSIGAVWAFLHLWHAKNKPSRTRRLVAAGGLIVFGIAVLQAAHSATSVACFLIGSTLIFVTSLRFIGRRPARVHALILMIFLVGGLTMLLGGEDGIVHALGRDTTFTGRTEIWQRVINVCPNPLVGAGFESFWNGYGDKVQRLSRYQGPLNSAHNGYLDVYLNLGFVGLGLIILILISGYQRACAAFRRDQEVGGLMLAYVATATFYSATEAGFRILTPSWISLLLASVASSGTIYGIIVWKDSQQRIAHKSPASVWAIPREIGSLQLGHDN